MKLNIRTFATGLGIFAASFAAMNAQTTNYALNFEGNGYVNCANIHELNNTQEYAIQAIVNPKEIVDGSYIFKRGTGADGLSLKVVAGGNLEFAAGNIVYSINSALQINSWTQVTIAAFANGIDVWINGNKQWMSNTNGAVIPSSDEPFVIGQGFKGQIDEFRIWNTAMPSSNPDNLMIRNTVNKYHPQYDNLLAYYKFDQVQSEGIVEIGRAHV